MTNRVGQVWEFSDGRSRETFIVLRQRHDYSQWIVFYLETGETVNLFENTFQTSEDGRTPHWRRLA